MVVAFSHFLSFLGKFFIIVSNSPTKLNQEQIEIYVMLKILSKSDTFITLYIIADILFHDRFNLVNL